MRLDDLMAVLRDEFAQAADDIDGQLMEWLGGGSDGAEGHATAVAEALERLARTARILSLEGLAEALEMVRDTVLALAVADADAMGQGLGWLAGWRAPMQACFDGPGRTGAVDALAAWLREGPLAPGVESLSALQHRLLQGPDLPPDALPAQLPQATDDDVSLELPADLLHDLMEAFLADAPAQLHRLGDAVRALGRGGLESAALQEAQRVAHTFKGSGNIIGIRGIGRMAHRIEDLIDHAATRGGRLPAAMARDLERATATLEQMVGHLRGEEDAPLDARECLQALLDWIEAVRTGTADEALEASRPSAAAAAPDLWPPSASPSAPQPAASPAVPADAEPQLRLGVSRVDRLVRRAGQSLVQGARATEHLRLLEQRLQAMQNNGALLYQRLRELQLALERQGVTLHEKAQDAAAGFDPLELDRYNQLHELSRFIAEVVDDERELTQASLAEAGAAAAVLREQGQAQREQHRELLATRLVPLRQVVPRLRRAVAQTATTLGRMVRLEVQGDEVQLDSDVLERLTEPLLHLLRNAVDHGIEAADERALLGKPEEGCITLEARRDGQTVRVSCRDDGRGLDLSAVHARALELGLLAPGDEPAPEVLMRLVLLPGFSTRREVTEVSGRGVGLDVVAERVRAMKGQLVIDSQPLEGTRFDIAVPATTGALHALIVDAGGERYAIPTAAVERALAADQGEREPGQLVLGDRRLPLRRLSALCGLAEVETGQRARPAVLVRSGGGVVALEVDHVIEARELVLQDLGRLLRRTAGVGAAAFRPDGRVMLVLDPESLLHADKAGALDAGARAQLRRRAQTERKRVLVVDDSLSARKALAQLLEDSGYAVTGARDGYDGLQQLAQQRVDLVLTDLEMPALNGLEMTRQLRGQPQTAGLPVVMITSRASDKHRDAAAQAGVDHYLTKPFTDDRLLALVRELMASPAGAPATAASSLMG